MQKDPFLLGLVAQIRVQQGPEHVKAFLEKIRLPSGELPKGLKGARTSATLAEVAAAVVRVHSLQLDESSKLPNFRGSFVKLASVESEEVEARVMWAGLEAVCPARSSPMQMNGEALGQILWLPTRSATGELLLRRAGALLRPSFLGVPAPARKCGALEAGQRTLLFQRVRFNSEWKEFVNWVAVPPSEPAQGYEHALRWEVFLADLKSERLVSRQFWEVLAKSADLRRHACRVFRENDSWLSDLEVPSSAGNGQRLSSFFRRGAFEPIVGEAALPYVDAPEMCEPYLEMLRVRCVANFENLAVALSCWTAKEPPPMCAPKALMNALLLQAIRERRPGLRLMDLKKKVFIPGKGTVDACQAVWSAENREDDFVRSVCKLANAPILQEKFWGWPKHCFRQDIYGESLRGWFCDFLNVRESPGVFQLLQALTSLLPNRLGGGDAKVTLTVVRQIYAELFMQLQEGHRVSQALEQRLKRDPSEQGETLVAHVERIFRSKRFVVLPQPRGRPWKFLTSEGAYWSVDEELADLPCSKFALCNFYASKVKAPTAPAAGAVDLQTFFVEAEIRKDVGGCSEELHQLEAFRRSAAAKSPMRKVVPEISRMMELALACRTD
eukprot:g362.t1